MPCDGVVHVCHTCTTWIDRYLPVLSIALLPKVVLGVVAYFSVRLMSETLNFSAWALGGILERIFPWKREAISLPERFAEVLTTGADQCWNILKLLGYSLTLTSVCRALLSNLDPVFRWTVHLYDVAKRKFSNSRTLKKNAVDQPNGSEKNRGDFLGPGFSAESHGNTPFRPYPPPLASKSLGFPYPDDTGDSRWSPSRIDRASYLADWNGRDSSRVFGASKNNMAGAVGPNASPTAVGGQTRQEPKDVDWNGQKGKKPPAQNCDKRQQNCCAPCCQAAETSTPPCGKRCAAPCCVPAKTTPCCEGNAATPWCTEYPCAIPCAAAAPCLQPGGGRKQAAESAQKQSPKPPAAPSPAPPNPSKCEAARKPVTKPNPPAKAVKAPKVEPLNPADGPSRWYQSRDRRKRRRRSPGTKSKGKQDALPHGGSHPSKCEAARKPTTSPTPQQCQQNPQQQQPQQQQTRQKQVHVAEKDPCGNTREVAVSMNTMVTTSDLVVATNTESHVTEATPRKSDCWRYGPKCSTGACPFTICVNPRLLPRKVAKTLMRSLLHRSRKKSPQHRRRHHQPHRQVERPDATQVCNRMPCECCPCPHCAESGCGGVRVDWCKESGLPTAAQGIPKRSRVDQPRSQGDRHPNKARVKICASRPVGNCSPTATPAPAATGTTQGPRIRGSDITFVAPQQQGQGGQSQPPTSTQRRDDKGPGEVKVAGPAGGADDRVAAVGNAVKCPAREACSGMQPCQRPAPD